MSYFYITITKKENILFLKDTVELIKKNCLRNSNKISIMLNKTKYSNCTLDMSQDSYIQVYDTDIDTENYEDFKTKYKRKYLVEDQDLEVISNIYNILDILDIEEFKVQVKITYNLTIINSLQLIIDILGKNEPMNNILYSNFGEIFNQVIVNNIGNECAIIENNHIYNAIYEQGSYKKMGIVEKLSIFSKYEQYKNFNKKFNLKGKKEIHKI